VDYLVACEVACLTVLDISGVALTRTKERLGPQAANVTWIESDVLSDWPVPSVDIWHDRAVFHFLTDPHDRERYLERLRRGLRRGGTLIMATFALDGPATCSGLPVARYSPEQLAAVLGPAFTLQEWIAAPHDTPFGSTQAFWYTRFVFAP